uniref:Uncharacterized protein n=1 Tax=Plectus sambesii TaxID=2011161 RepID=A0A914VS05_9BILA
MHSHSNNPSVRGQAVHAAALSANVPRRGITSETVAERTDGKRRGNGDQRKEEAGRLALATFSLLTDRSTQGLTEASHGPSSFPVANHTDIVLPTTLHACESAQSDRHWQIQ